MKKFIVAAVLVGSVALGVTGCVSRPAEPTFAEKCDSAGGTVLEDSKTSSVTTYGSGGVGFGTTKVTVAVCVVGGDVVSMEVR